MSGCSLRDLVTDGGDRGRIAVGGDHHCHPRPLCGHRKLIDGDKGHWRDIAAEIVVLGVGDGADDFVGALWILRLGLDVHQLADGRLACRDTCG